MSQPSPSVPIHSFFARFLTVRHLLTPRWAVGLALLLTLSGWGVWLLIPSLQPRLTAPAHAGMANAAEVAPAASNAARPLTVNAQPLSQSGPDYLIQNFTGVVAPRRSTRLAAKILGRIESMQVQLGDRVAAGDVLIELDRRQLESEREVVKASWSAAQALLAELQHGPRPQELEQSQARVQELRSLTELQQANLTRTEILRNSAAISTQEVEESRFRTDAVEAQLEAAQQSLELLQAGTREEQLAAQQAKVEGLAAQLKSLDIQLAETRIVAPYAGHIQARLVDEGAIVSAGQPLLEIVETAALEVHVGLPPELVSEVSSDNLSVSLGSRKLAVMLSRISPSIHPATRTQEVVLTIGEHDYRPLAVGSAVQVELKTRVDAHGHWIPTMALTAGPRGLWAVYIAVPADGASAHEHLIERRQVELLRSQGDWSEVRGPIDAQELLVVNGVHRIVAGQRVVCASLEKQ